MPKNKLKVSEADVQQAVVLMLELDGWRFFRTELTVQRDRGRVVGERGMPDALFIRYDPRFIGSPGIRRSVLPTDADVLWIETKAPGKPLAKHQREWAEAERKRGAMVLKVDSIDDFKAWYLASGLNRRIIS